MEDVTLTEVPKIVVTVVSALLQELKSTYIVSGISVFRSRKGWSVDVVLQNQSDGTTKAISITVPSA